MPTATKFLLPHTCVLLLLFFLSTPAVATTPNTSNQELSGASFTLSIPATATMEKNDPGMDFITYRVKLSGGGWFHIYEGNHPTNYQNYLTSTEDIDGRQTKLGKVDDKVVVWISVGNNWPNVLQIVFKDDTHSTEIEALIRTLKLK